MTEYTGPTAIPDHIWENWYHRMKNLGSALVRNRHGFVCHPDDQAMMNDFLERLKEDEDWPLPGQYPILVVSETARPGQIQPVNMDTMKEASIRQAIKSTTGFGRFTGLATPRKNETRLPLWVPPSARG